SKTSGDVNVASGTSGTGAGIVRLATGQRASAPGASVTLAKEGIDIASASTESGSYIHLRAGDATRDGAGGTVSVLSGRGSVSGSIDVASAATETSGSVSFTSGKAQSKSGVVTIETGFGEASSGGVNIRSGASAGVAGTIGI
ncbi:unnamed protein product, partial [Aphanomyces euteiches]